MLTVMFYQKHLKSIKKLK